VGVALRKEPLVIEEDLVGIYSLYVKRDIKEFGGYMPDRKLILSGCRQKRAFRLKLNTGILLSQFCPKE